MKKIIAVIAAVILLFTFLSIDSFAAKKNVLPPQLMSSEPKSKQADVQINKVINLVFNEDIYAGKTFAKIILQYDNSTIGIKTTISKNILSIKPNENLNYNKSFTLKIPAGALRDRAGNTIKNPVLLIFKTANKPVPAVTPTPMPPKDQVSEDKAVKSVTPAAVNPSEKYKVFIGTPKTATDYLDKSQIENAKQFIIDYKEENGSVKIETAKFDLGKMGYILMPFPMVDGTVSDLTEKGFALRQIYKAYMIGNTVYLDPKKLLDICRSNNLDLDAIEAEIHSYIKSPKMSVLITMEEMDLKDLLSKGFEGKDIFKAYALGNELCIEPKSILQVKKFENKDFNAIKNEIMAQMTRKSLNQLAAKYPREFEYLSNEKLSESTIVTLLRYYNLYNVQSIEVLLEDYRNNNSSSEYIYNKYKNNKRGVSQEYIDKYGLSQEDIEGINDDIIRKLETFIKNKPELTVKKFLQQLQEARKKL